MEGTKIIKKTSTSSPLEPHEDRISFGTTKVMKKASLHVTLTGVNYLLWARTTRTALCSHRLWNHITSEVSREGHTREGAIVPYEESDWFQEDQTVLSLLQGSLSPETLEAYSYCETAKELWETLEKVYGNVSNLSRIFEVKKAINELQQEDMEFTKHFGKFRSLWAELEMLRPSTLDPMVLNERREQDKVFALLFTLNPSYNDLIKHLLRADKLPNLEEVCSKIQKEQGSVGLFGGRGELVTAHQGELASANKGAYKHEDKKSLFCDHCKKKGHTKEKCWILHPHLKPNKWKDAKASFASDGADGKADGRAAGGPSTRPNEGDGAALAASSQFVTKADLDALIKALKESGNTLGRSFHVIEDLSNHYTVDSLSHVGQSLHANGNKPLIVDSGASHHMISDRNLISNIQPALGNVIIANGTKVPVKGIGELDLFNKKSKAFYMPSFTSNLLSVKRVTSDLECLAIFSPNDVCFQDIKTRKVLGKGSTRDDLYLLEDTKPHSNLSSISHIAVANNAIWHARLGHPHSRALSLLLPSISFKNDKCEACILGKHCRNVFPKSSTIYEKCFDLVHSDVWTSPCESRDQNKYFVTFIDEKSKYTWLTLLPSKDRVFEAFKNFQNHVTNHFNAKIKIFRSDNGGEYMGNIFKEHLAKHGIIHQTSCPYTPQQNGVAERKNRHLMEVARALLFHHNVPKRFWGDAVLSACYLINRLPTRILSNSSPYEVLNQTKPSIDHLRIFGCVCYVLIPGDQRNKLDARSTKAMFVGYSTTQKGYKCYLPDTRRVVISRDVKFLETEGFYKEKNWENLKDLSQPSSDRASNLRTLLDRLGIPLPGPPQVSQDTPPDSVDASPVDHEGGNGAEPVSQGDNGHDQDEASITREEEQEPVPEPVALRRSTRVRKDPANWANTRVYYNSNAVAHPAQITCSLAQFPKEHQVFMGTLLQEEVPKTYEEAKEHKVWRDAVGDEVGAMERNHTWDEADLPKGKKPVSSRWVFTIKYHSNGEIERHKARLVARGFTQTFGEDYRDTFAPVAKLHTVRVVLSLATNLEWDLWQMDVKNAFLQGELEEEVYMTPPPGLEGSVSPGKVLRLRKAIYGLKQSPRAWYHKLSRVLLDRGFSRSEADHTLFTLTGQRGIVVILVYVDDIIISGDDKVSISETKSYLKSVLDIKDLGELKYFLGIEVCRLKEGLFLSQRKYALDLLSEAGELGTRPAKTPLEDDYKVDRKGELEDELYDDATQYRRMVGKLIYLTITRPDLCFAVNQVSQHMKAPKVYHWDMVNRILRYLRNTTGQGIWMGCNQNTEIVGYCDADWAGDREDRRSTTGYCTFIGGNLVTWKSKKQKIVSCSSAEAEYRAMRKLTTELMWLKNLLKDFGINQSTPITMHCDNQAAMHIASNSVFHERTKHIEVDCHKVREQVQLGVILPCYTRSADQLADIFTKAVTQKTSEFIHSKLGLTDLSTA